ILGGIVIAVISRLLPPPGPNSYLDPASTAPDGAHALTDILGDRGYDVIRAYSASSAVAALSSGTGDQRPRAGGPATLVVTSPYLLTHRQLVRLGRSEADLVVVEAGPGSLTTLAPRVRLKHALTGRFGQLLRPDCDLAAASLAGTANLGGATYRAPPSGTGCYPSDGFPSLVRSEATYGRMIPALGSGAPLTNGWPARNGNAALVVTLPSEPRQIVWLPPEPPMNQPAAARPGAPGRAAPALIPWQAWLVVIQL